MMVDFVKVICVSSLFTTLPLSAETLTDETQLLSNTRQLTFEGRRAGEGYFNADGSRMIFQSERDPNNPFYQIYIMDLQNGDVDLVSPGYGKTTCSWMHPSNDKVLYGSTHEDPKASDKMKIELDFRASGKKRRYSWDFDPAFDIYEQNLKSGARINLTQTMGYDAEAAYSPDGSKIVFASNRRAFLTDMSETERSRFEHDNSYMMDLYLMNSDGSDVRQLTNSPGYDGGPFFSFDGKKITWRRFSSDGRKAEIYTMDLATGEEKQLTHTGIMSWAPFFHPSGDYVIYASNKEGYTNFELYMVDANGEHEPVRITYNEKFDGLPVFSPDGQHLSWTSTRGGGKVSQIFLADWNDSEARRLLELDERLKIDKDEGLAANSTKTIKNINNQALRKHVMYLSSEELEGRQVGSKGELKATQYVASIFEKLGLEPAGNDGFFQTFTFATGAKLGENNTLSIHGIKQGQPIELGKDWLPLTITKSGELSNAGIVFAGYGIEAPGLDKDAHNYDNYGDLDVTGKWVMIFRFQPESVSPELRRHFLHYSDLSFKAAIAKRRGAKGLVIVTGPEAESKNQLIQLGREANGVSSSIAAISITDELASRILANTGRDLGRLQKRLDKGESLEGFPIENITLSAELAIQRNTRQGRNVIARLPADAPSQKAPVILGAHIDHLGKGAVPDSLDTGSAKEYYHPGADDNASGVAALLESARYLVELKKAGNLGSKRDILFAAWSGEELGTLGSTYFVEQIIDKKALDSNVSAYLNMDMIGRLRDKVYLQGTGSSSIWPREIERSNVSVGLAIYPQVNPYLPTDSTPFYSQGIPIISAFTGTHEDYSTSRDTADRLNYEGMEKIAQLMSGITHSLACSEKRPEYLEVSRNKTGLSRNHLRAYLGTIPAYGGGGEEKGVKLQGAVKGGPAEKAGIEKGDVLIWLAGREIGSIHDFMNALGGLKPGEETEMKVIRNKMYLTLHVIPTSRE